MILKGRFFSGLFCLVIGDHSAYLIDHSGHHVNDAIGGVVGTVVSVKDDKFVIETSADQVRVEFAKWAISTNETAAAAKAEEARKAREAKAKAKAVKKAEKNADK